jgi:hypothetical protein
MFANEKLCAIACAVGRGGPENSDSRISGRFASQSQPKGRIQEQKHDQENKTEPLRKFQGESGLSGVTRG